MSQRRACRTLDQSLSTQRYRPAAKEDEPSLIKRILELVLEFPRFGYRRITRLLRNEGWKVNAKRVYRLWRQEGLKVPKKTVKRRRLGSADGGIVRRKAESRDHVWSVDFIFDRTINGRSLKMLVVIDEFTRECLALEVGRKFTGEHLVEVLIDLFAIRGVPSSFVATMDQSLSRGVSVTSWSRSMWARSTSNLAVLGRTALLRVSTAASAMSA